MVKRMKQEKFEELLCIYGADLAVWPEELRGAAQRYAETEVGAALLEAEAEIDQLFEASFAIGPENASDSNSDAFLSRLSCIPEQHGQAVYSPVGALSPFMQLKTLFADTFRFSAASYALQGFAFVAVLTAGIMVGAQTTVATATDDDLDLSEDWFASASEVEGIE